MFRSCFSLKRSMSGFLRTYAVVLKKTHMFGFRTQSSFLIRPGNQVFDQILRLFISNSSGFLTRFLTSFWTTKYSVQFWWDRKCSVQFYWERKGYPLTTLIFLRPNRITGYPLTTNEIAILYLFVSGYMAVCPYVRAHVAHDPGDMQA